MGNEAESDPKGLSFFQYLHFLKGNLNKAVFNPKKCSSDEVWTPEE